jgi:signal transduction histidine kinase
MVPGPGPTLRNRARGDDEKSRDDLLAELRSLRALLSYAVGGDMPAVECREIPEDTGATSLIAAAADEFGDLLTVINGCADLLLDALTPDEPARELVAAIQKAGGRAAELTRALLAFSLRATPVPLVIDAGK